MSNREKRIVTESVHMYLALARPVHGEKAGCIRTIDKGNQYELNFLISKLKIIGGNWRIHKTVNARNCDKAMRWLLKDLIDHPEHASYIDSQWRTALLQPECRVTNYFMLDVDTQEERYIRTIEATIDQSQGEVIQRIQSPKGWHFITTPFDTRHVCEMQDVTLLRDGYYFICEVRSDE